MVSVPVPTIRRRPLDNIADLLPLLPKVLHRLKQQIVLSFCPGTFSGERMSRSSNVMIDGDDGTQLQSGR